MALEDLMSWFNKYLFELIVALSVVLIIAIARKFYQNMMIANDSSRIITFLESSGKKFRSTHAIASHTNLTEDRVRMLCSNANNIRRNEKEKESWTLR